MATALYAGPGKVYFNSKSLFPEGENGPVTITIDEDAPEIASGMHGKLGYQLRDQKAEVVTRPFDHWDLLATLFPTYVGATTSGGTGLVAIGTRPHTSSNVALKVWAQDGRLYNMVRGGIIGHPSLHLGVGKPLFGDVRFSAIGDLSVSIGGTSFLFASDAITESAAADPGATDMAFTTTFIRGAWTGVWGTVAGFGGAAGSLGTTKAVEAEDEWTINTEIKYDALTVQGRTMAYKLASCAYMASCKPYGPSHTDIVAALAADARAQGARLGSADLTLTGPSSKTITLKNAEIKGAGFQLGGATLGTGEVGFVNLATFTTGVMQPLIVFSS